MHCPKCGRPAASGTDRCTSCGTRFLAPGSSGDTATGALSGVSEGATVTAAPIDFDATVLTPTPQTDPDRTFLTPPPQADPDATRLTPTPHADPDQTRMGVPPAYSDETRIEAGPLSEAQAYFAADTAVPRPPSAARAYAENAQDLVGKSLGPRYQIIKMLG